jgi:hypothetical protein
VDQTTHNKIVSFIWGIADDVLRDLFKRGKYPDVILPMCVIRRMDAVLESTKKAVLDTKKMLDEARITSKLLKFLWKCAERDPHQEITSEYIRQNCFPPSSEPGLVRAIATRIRKNLTHYFDCTPEEKIRVAVERGTYRVIFSENKPSWLSAGSVLDAIWEPFLSPPRMKSVPADAVTRGLGPTPKKEATKKLKKS